MLTLKLSQGHIFRILSGSSLKIALVTVHELMQGNMRKKRLKVLQDEIHNQQTNNAITTIVPLTIVVQQQHLK